MTTLCSATALLHLAGQHGMESSDAGMVESLVRILVWVPYLLQNEIVTKLVMYFSQGSDMQVGESRAVGSGKVVHVTMAKKRKRCASESDMVEADDSVIRLFRSTFELFL